MWGLHYDENLNNNPFLKEILTNHDDIVKRASQENWIICIPRNGTFAPGEISSDAILDHILVPGTAPSEFFCTLSKKQIVLRNRQLVTVENRPNNPIRILFEETFYIDGFKYCVFCLERPLFITHLVCDAHRPTVLETLHDCIDFLWGEGLGHVLGKIQKLCASFVDQNPVFETESLQSQRDLIGSLYSQCLQVVLKKQSFDGDLDNLKLAVETYMQSCLDRTVTRAVNTVTCFRDSSFNKIVRNASELQLKDLNISNRFCETVSNAKLELGKINNYVTVLDKVNCLKLTFGHLYNTNVCLTSDDVLQLFVFLITKLNVSNWNSNLVYLTQFQFSSFNTSNENSFLTTSLEAALEFIKSHQFAQIRSSHTSANNRLFQAIQSDNLALLQELLDYEQCDKDASLCHPLCDCDSCTDSSDSSHDTCTFNEKGQSLLAFATILDRSEIAEFLVGMGAEVETRDYFGKTPLHYACLKGFQDVLLILINGKADVNVRDNDGNTPLHLASNNGHENCVKALFYTCKGLDVNCVNKYGETPLHLAIKWNYVNITRTLLENGALCTVCNKKNQLPVNLAQNLYTERLLRQYNKDLQPNPETNQPYPTSDVKPVNCKEHGIRPKSLDQIKKIDLLLKAIENNDLPLTCFYLGFSADCKDYNFQSKCHPLCNCDKCEDLSENPKSVVDRINVNICNIDGFTPVHFAAKYGRLDLLRILLDSHALPNLKTYKTLQTPLHLACIYQRLQIVKELTKCSNCEVDSQDYKGNTALYYACMKNDTKIVEVLLNNGANCDIRNYEGQSVIKEVRDKRLYGISNLLKDQTSEDNDFL